MQNLLKLPSTPLLLTNLRYFYDKIKTSIRDPESLGQFHDTFRSLLVPIIFGQVPTKTHKSLTQEHFNSWDIRSLREVIGKEAYEQEAGNFKMFKTSSTTASYHIGAKTRNYTYIQQNRENKNKKK